MTPADKPVGHRILKPESGRSELGRKMYGRAYVHGNIVEGYDEVNRDNWAGGVQIEDLPDAGVSTPLIRVDKPFPMPELTILAAGEAYKFVLDNAGATLPVRDAVDERIIRQVRTGQIFYIEGMEAETGSEYIRHRLPADSYKQGIIRNIDQVGGYPEYRGEPYKDSDGDGMPDDWEKAHAGYGFDPADPSDAMGDCNGDGYTNIEKYLNAIPLGAKVNWTDPANNYDTLSENKKGL
jgi:hypothetical protein